MKIKTKTENSFIDTPSLDYYQQLEFWESDHLIALTFNENYYLEFWNFRTGILLKKQKTDFLVDNQFIQ